MLSVTELSDQPCRALAASFRLVASLSLLPWSTDAWPPLFDSGRMRTKTFVEWGRDVAAAASDGDAAIVGCGTSHTAMRINLDSCDMPM